MALPATRSAPDTAAPRHDDTVAQILEVVTLRLNQIPALPGFGEVGAHPFVPAVPTALDAGPGQRQEFHLRVIQPEQRIDIPGAHRLEALPDELDVVRHTSRCYGSAGLW
jgi:hypothetical protein